MKSEYEQKEHLLMIFRRTERLTTALYLVTNLFHDNEPLKWVLREKGVYLLSNVLPLSGRPLSTEVRERLRPTISELVGHLGVAKVAGIVSEMNSSVLKREYLSLIEHLESLKDIPTGAVVRESSVPEEDGSVLSDIIKDIYKRHSIGHIDKGHYLMSYRSSPEKSAVGSGTQEEKAAKRKRVTVIRDKQEPTKRKGQIMKLFQDGQKHTIKDVANAIEGVSEKTIQRDLGNLVFQGVLRKEGERRWSRYFLPH